MKVKHCAIAEFTGQTFEEVEEKFYDYEFTKEHGDSEVLSVNAFVTNGIGRGLLYHIILAYSIEHE